MVDSAQYEKQVARIVQSLFDEIDEIDASNTQCGRTSFVDGASGHSHQIDVQIGGDSDLYLIECKCWKDSIPVEAVLAFYGRISDIQGCQSRSVHGSIVTKTGYQAGAEKVAAYFGIDLAYVKSESDFAIRFKGNIWVGLRGAAMRAQGGEVTVITDD
jgi:hypothetical protein